MIGKHGMRIVTLAMLATYVDPGFLCGNLHREGGVVFFMIGLLLMVPVFWLLQGGEDAPNPNLQPAKLSAPGIETCSSEGGEHPTGLLLRRDSFPLPAIALTTILIAVRGVDAVKHHTQQILVAKFRRYPLRDLRIGA